MKKLFLVCAMLCACGLVNVSAEGTRKVVKTYYGTEANDSFKNPCRGECVVICATIEETVANFTDVSMFDGLAIFFANSMPQTYIKMIMKDADGNVVNEYEEVRDGDVETVYNQEVAEALSNGATVE